MCPSSRKSTGRLTVCLIIPDLYQPLNNVFPSQSTDLHQVFAEHDTDESGYLIYDEVKDYLLKKAVQNSGGNPTDADVKKYVDQLDYNGRLVVMISLCV